MELITNQKTISSIEISTLIGKNHSHVMRDIRLIEEKLINPNLDSLWKATSYNDSRGRKQPIYQLTKKGTLLLVSKYDDNIRLKVIDRWEELEKQQQHQIPQSYSEALLLASKQAEQIELQKAELQLQAPKAKYYDEVLDSKSTYVANQIAKELGTIAVTLNRKLKEMGVQYKQNGTWLLYRKYQDKGLTDTKTYQFTDRSGQTQTAMQTVWTEKGRLFIHELFLKQRESA